MGSSVNKTTIEILGKRNGQLDLSICVQNMISSRPIPTPRPLVRTSCHVISLVHFCILLCIKDAVNLFLTRVLEKNNSVSICEKFDL